MFGGCISSKVYKYKDKLILYLPKDVVYNLGIKEGDELNFLKDNNYYIMAKSNAIIGSLTDKDQSKTGKSVSPKEISVLRKLDSFRYANRTVEEVGKKLTGDEKAVLEGMIKKGYVVPKKSGNAVLYSINNDIYVNFLIKDPEAFERKHKASMKWAREQQANRKPAATRSEFINKEKGINENASEEIRRNGYVVLSTRAEAENASSELEIEIRRGLVLGTRAFNKKYYIVHRAFVNKNSPKLVGALRSGDMDVNTLSKKTGMDPDGVRSVLFVLAESGEVMEKRRDVFSLVE